MASREQNSRRTLLLAAMALAASGRIAKAQRVSKDRLVVNQYEGVSVQVDLGAGIVLNKASTLRTRWIVLQDVAAPLQVAGRAGIEVVYRQDDSRSLPRYRYQLRCSIKGTAPSEAFEIRAHTFDVFGNWMRTLAATRVMDIDLAESFEATWTIPHESEAGAMLTSVVYVSRARPKAGPVYQIDPALVSNELLATSLRIASGEVDLPRQQ